MAKQGRTYTAAKRSIEPGRLYTPLEGVRLSVDLCAFYWHFLLLVWLLIALVSRYSSLGAIVAALAAPVATICFLGWGPFAWMVLAMTALLLWRHRANIRNLLAGTEGKIAG
jgi:glycerol-3-phosphate acyltransferase PlsY